MLNTVKAVKAGIKMYPERSDNWLAEDLGVSKNTIAEQREELEATCQIDKLEKTKGKDGETQSAHKTGVARATPESDFREVTVRASGAPSLLRHMTQQKTRCLRPTSPTTSHPAPNRPTTLRVTPMSQGKRGRGVQKLTADRQQAIREPTTSKKAAELVGMSERQYRRARYSLNASQFGTIPRLSA